MGFGFVLRGVKDGGAVRLTFCANGLVTRGAMVIMLAVFSKRPEAVGTGVLGHRCLEYGIVDTGGRLD